MRIALVTNNYTPYSGGVVSSINAFAQQLMARGHTVLIISLNFLGDAHQDEPYVKRVVSIAHFMYKKNPMAVPWCPDAEVFNYLQEFKPDIVHVQHPFLLGQSALTAARKLSVLVLFTYHTLYEHYSHYVPLYQPLVKAVIKKKVLQFCSRVDHIVAPSSAVHEYLIQNNIVTPISVIPSPLQQEFFCTQEQIKTEASAPFRLLLVSRLVPEKNIPYVIDIMAQLDKKDYMLTIVGYGEQEAALYDYAYNTLKLSEAQIRFVIQPSKKDLIHWYRNADLFLFPSISDTQGLVLAESMASGVPVLALDGPGQRDIVRDGVNGFIVHSTQDMLTALSRVSQDSHLLQHLRIGALQTAQLYQPSVLTDRLINVYLRLMHNS